MADLHAIALLLRSTNLKKSPLSSSDQDLYLELLKTYKRLGPTGTANKQFQKLPLPSKPFTGPELILYFNQTISAPIRKSWGNVNNQSKSPKSWGPVVWRFLHWISLSFTMKNKAQFAKFLKLVGRTLPCKECSSHFNAVLRTTAALKSLDAVSDLAGFVNYVILLHVLVNKQVAKGKKYLLYKNVPKGSHTRQSIGSFLRRNSYYNYSSGRQTSAGASIVELNRHIKNSQPKSSGCGCSS